MRQKYILIIVIALGLFACEKNNDILNGDSYSLKSSQITNSNDLSKYQPEELIQLYNVGMHEFAQALAKTLKNEKLRESIKDEALLKNDGDFDIIWKGFKDNDIEGESIIKKVAKNANNKLAEKEKVTKIEAFSSIFRQLQLSVPINIDKWDASNQIPVVAFREANAKGVSDFLYTYDKDGNQGKIEKGVIPNYPVVVINLNERSDEDGNILNEYNKNFQNMLKSARTNPLFGFNPITTNSTGEGTMPYDFSGVYVNNFIMLSWTYDFTDDDYHQIQIERENGSGFQLIQEISAYEGSNYYPDYSVQTGNNYFYRIRSKVYDYANGTTTYSGYTPAISVSTGATGIPEAPANFSNIAEDPNEIQLFWSYPTTTNITGFKLSKRLKDSGQNYDTPTIIPASNRSYLDLGTKQAGKKYDYKLTAYNSISESSEVFGVAWNPHRTHTDHIYIKQIEYLNLNDSDFESWAEGSPETQVSVFQSANPTGTTEMLTELKRITETNTILARDPNGIYKNCIYGYNVDLLGFAWDPIFYKGVITCNFVEDDNEPWYIGWKSISISVKMPVKVLGGDINIEAAGSITNSIKNWDKSMGEAHVSYWDPCVNHTVQVWDAMKVTFSNQ